MNPKNRTEDDPTGIQADSYQYISSRYLTPERMSSIGYQYDLSIKTRCDTFIEVGSANNILRNLLHLSGKSVVALDITNESLPNIVGRLPVLPFEDNSFDVGLCFQVLEHLPYSMFLECLMELKRVTRFSVIISLPDRSENRKLINKVKRFAYSIFHFPRNWKHSTKKLDVEHFWEIGINVQINDILSALDTLDFIVIANFQNPYFPYHRFLVLANKSIDPNG